MIGYSLNNGEMTMSSNIDVEVMKRLNSYETSQLIRVLEGLEDKELMLTGLKFHDSGYAEAKATDIILNDDIDEDTGKETDVIELTLEAGTMDECGTDCKRVTGTINRCVLGKQNPSLKDMLESIRI